MKAEQDSLFESWLETRLKEEPSGLEQTKLAQTVRRIDSLLNQIFSGYFPPDSGYLRRLKLKLGKENFSLMDPLMLSFFQDGFWQQVQPDIIRFQVNEMPQVQFYKNNTYMITAYSENPLSSVAITVGEIPRGKEGVSVSLNPPTYSPLFATHPLTAALFAENFAQNLLNLSQHPNIKFERPKKYHWRKTYWGGETHDNQPLLP